MLRDIEKREIAYCPRCKEDRFFSKTGFVVYCCNFCKGVVSESYITSNELQESARKAEDNKGNLLRRCDLLSPEMIFGKDEWNRRMGKK